VLRRATVLALGALAAAPLVARAQGGDAIRDVLSLTRK